VTTDRTLFLLLAEFGTGQIPVERCAHHFGMTPEQAKRTAARQQLPVPAFRLGSQKSPWLISAEHLAAHISDAIRDPPHASATRRPRVTNASARASVERTESSLERSFLRNAIVPQ